MFWSLLHTLLPRIESSSDNDVGFPNFTAIDNLDSEGVQLPAATNKSTINLVDILPRLVKAYDLLQFEKPELIKRDTFSWLKDEEFARQTLAGLNPCSIQLITYVGLNKQGHPRPICITRVSKGPALVNDKNDTVESGELERKIETETLSFNNVQSQGNDYWQDLEILPENDVQLQANDDNEVDKNVDDYRDGMDINADDQNVKSPAGNSKNTASSYSSGPEVVEDNQFTNDQLLLRVRCTLHSSPEEREEEYVRLFISGPRRKDPILDTYLHEDGEDSTAGDEEPDNIFEQVRENDSLRSPVADEHEGQRTAKETDDREVDTGVNGTG
ncbi:Lipoxygenase [Forsythia ovata]|uniref:Lipoxygenase n=1 Tax=Forsythia ovata TaxID=205694 RepID=A0ABD1RHT3_9LAMI